MPPYTPQVFGANAEWGPITGPGDNFGPARYVLDGYARAGLISTPEQLKAAQNLGIGPLGVVGKTSGGNPTYGYVARGNPQQSAGTTKLSATAPPGTLAAKIQQLTGGGNVAHYGIFTPSDSDYSELIVFVVGNRTDLLAGIDEMGRGFRYETTLLETGHRDTMAAVFYRGGAYLASRDKVSLHIRESFGNKIGSRRRMNHLTDDLVYFSRRGDGPSLERLLPEILKGTYS